MNILAPVCNSKEIRKLMLVGCTEFYFGFVSMAWVSKYTSRQAIDQSLIMVSPNKRAGLNQSITNYEEARDLCLTAKRYKTRIYMALNAFSFPYSEYEYVDEIISMFDETLIDGFIVTDVGMIKHLKSKVSDQIKIVLSTCQLAINSDSVRFFRDLGVSRITFTRHMRMAEIKEIMEAVPEIEYEIFAMDGKCMYDESNCRAIHCAGQFCMQRYHYSHCYLEKADNVNDEVLNNEFEAYSKWPLGNRIELDKWPPMGCTLCRIREFIDCNMTTMKVSGRGLALQERMGIVKLTRKAIDISEGVKHSAEAQEQVQLMCKELFVKDYCKDHKGCYIS